MPEQFGKEYWEERSRGHEAAPRRQPNAQLVAEAADLPPGTALDAGCGEGADAIWLASRGWDVTAVDVAGSALARAREHAASPDRDATGSLDWVEADIVAWLTATHRYDLVSAQYVHAPEPREALFQRLAGAVAPGGTLLVVGHHTSDVGSVVGHAPLPESRTTAEEVRAILDPGLWDVLVAETRSREVTDPHGRAVTLRDAVLRARRRR